MINLADLKLSDLLPSSISNDVTISNIAKAIDYELQEITKAINESILIPRIDELNEEIIDLLAWQFHVDFYEPLGMNLEKKRLLVKNALIWHKSKGTKSVIEEMISILYSSECTVSEWFEYSGKPYFFMLIINNIQLKKEDYGYILRAVYELKNVRSWLEKIKINKSVKQDVYIAHTINKNLKYKIDFNKRHSINFANLHYATAIKNKKSFKVENYNEICIPNLQTSLLFTVKISKKYFIRAT